MDAKKTIKNLVNEVNGYYDVEIKSKQQSLDKTRATYVYVKTAIQLGFNNSQIAKTIGVTQSSVSAYFHQYKTTEPCLDNAAINTLYKEFKEDINYEYDN